MESAAVMLRFHLEPLGGIIREELQLKKSRLTGIHKTALQVKGKTNYEPVGGGSSHEADSLLYFHLLNI